MSNSIDIHCRGGGWRKSGDNKETHTEEGVFNVNLPLILKGFMNRLGFIQTMCSASQVLVIANKNSCTQTRNKFLYPKVIASASAFTLTFSSFSQADTKT